MGKLNSFSVKDGLILYFWTTYLILISRLDGYGLLIRGKAMAKITIQQIAAVPSEIASAQ